MSKPIPMLLFCPRCALQHVDAPQPERQWSNPPHRSHECQGCNHVWRPADVETTGVLAIETAGQRDGSAVPLVAEVLKYAEVLHVNGDLKLTFKDRVFAALLGRFRFATRTPLSLALQGDRVTMVSQAGTVDFVPVFPKWWPRRQLGVMAPK